MQRCTIVRLIQFHLKDIQNAKLASSPLNLVAANVLLDLRFTQLYQVILSKGERVVESAMARLGTRAEYDFWFKTVDR